MRGCLLDEGEPAGSRFRRRRFARRKIWRRRILKRADKSHTKTYAKVRVESVQALDDRRIASGSAPSLFPGAKLTTEEIPAQGDNKECLILRCTLSHVDQTYVSGCGAPIADEIDVDKDGCILLKFYWDRKKDLSRRVRVAQFWSGATRGAWFCPRIGDEVLVAYEDGDPDRPMVVGSVYNGENKVPTTLPDKKTHSGILTKSSKSSDGYHMLMFDDTVGQERVKLRSQKDLMFKALNNEQRDILMDQTENVRSHVATTTGHHFVRDARAFILPSDCCWQ